MDFLALKRFTKVQIAGCGGSGHVLAAVDAETKQHVAIKRLTLSNQYRSRQCLRELRIMRNMQHENVVKVYDILGSDGSSLKNMASETTEVKTLYVVQELLDVDLHRLIRSNALQEGHSKLLFFQLLRGIKYIHSANVQHRDLSPSNIFVNLSTLLLKIGDFGSARVVDPSYNHQVCVNTHYSVRIIFCYVFSTNSVSCYFRIYIIRCNSQNSTFRPVILV